MYRLRLVGLVSIVAILGLITPVQASGTNCWGTRLFRHKLDRTLLSSDRCDKPTFHLKQGEDSRNIRSSPSGKVIGKMNEVGDYSVFESGLIATYDDGKSYWAFGEAFSESNPEKRLKGWVEVGDQKAIAQYHRPGSNDVWYKF
jgi:hypothetical protein